MNNRKVNHQEGNQQEEIYKFATKYLQLYTDPKTKELEVEEGFPEPCFAFGFEMDCGHRFIERFGSKAFYENEELEQIIDDIDDLSLLASGIFSHWRYVTHWSYCEHLLDKHNRPWFITAFERLVEMTRPPKLIEEENRQIDGAFPSFKGKLWKFQLTSPNTGYFGPTLHRNSEIEQRLTITADGRIKLLRYRYGTAPDHPELFEKQNYRIAPERAEKIMKAVSGYFKEEHRPDFVTDISSWHMTLTNTEGRRFKASGPLCHDLFMPSGGLSDLIRAELGRNDLLVFDGLPDIVQYLEIQYCRYSEDEDSLFEELDLTEEQETEESEVLADREILLLDRKSGLLDYRRETGSGFKETKTWKARQWGREALEKLVWITESLENRDETPDDLNPREAYLLSRRLEERRQTNASSPAKDSNEFSSSKYSVESSSPTYSIRMMVRHQGKLEKITTSFDQNELPDVWVNFLEDIHSFMASAKPGEIFNAIHNQKTIPDQDHFIFCNVVFGHGRRTYSYLADQDDYAPGGQVIVPVGADNREAVATIRSIKMHSKEDVPYPIKKMKHILRKYREEDEDA